MKNIFSLLHLTSNDDATVDLTPLIDVVFVVLILFILIAPLVEIDRIQLAHGKEKKVDTTSFQKHSKVIIHVYKDNTIALNGSPITIDGLKKALIKFYKKDPTTLPQILHDREAFFNTYQSIKNIAEEVGFESLDIILQSQ